MTREVFDRTGYHTLSFKHDGTDDQWIVGSHQDVAPIMQDIHARQTDGTGGWNADRSMRHRARIPMAVYDGWLREARRLGIPIYHKEVKDRWIAKKLAEHERLTIKGQVGFSGGFGAAQLARHQIVGKLDDG